MNVSMAWRRYYNNNSNNNYGVQRQKGKGVKIKHNKQQNKKLVVILHIYGTHIHTHIYTERLGTVSLLGWWNFTRNPAVLRKDCPFLRCQEHAAPPCVAWPRARWPWEEPGAGEALRIAEGRRGTSFWCGSRVTGGFALERFPPSSWKRG